MACTPSNNLYNIMLMIAPPDPITGEPDLSQPRYFEAFYNVDFSGDSKPFTFIKTKLTMSLCQIEQFVEDSSFQCVYFYTVLPKTDVDPYVKINISNDERLREMVMMLPSLAKTSRYHKKGQNSKLLNAWFRTQDLENLNQACSVCWSCPTCTFENTGSHLCEMCETAKPAPKTDECHTAPGVPELLSFPPSKKHDKHQEIERVRHHEQEQKHGERQAITEPNEQDRNDCLAIQRDVGVVAAKHENFCVVLDNNQDFEKAEQQNMDNADDKQIRFQMAEEEFAYDGMCVDESDDDDDEPTTSHASVKLYELAAEQIPGLTITLFEYQKKGVAWMLQKEQDKKCKGGLLCDQMGKTIEIIALMLASRHQARERKRIQFEQNGVSSYEGDDDVTDSKHDEATNLDGFRVHDDPVEFRSDEDFEVTERNEDEDQQQLRHDAINEEIKIRKCNKKRKSVRFNYFGPVSKRDGSKFEPNAKPWLNAKQRTLIVAPLAILDQWAQEINEKTLNQQFKVAVYYGTNRKLKFGKHVLRDCDVVITTYQVVACEYAKGDNEKQSGLFKLPQKFFHRVVLDEAHLIKNGTSQQAIACTNIGNRGVKVRWCLTGTPIQDRLQDLYPLCRFLQIRGCGTKHHFQKTLCLRKHGAGKDTVSGESKMKVAAFLAAHMLRRLKSDVVDNLVSKTEEVVQFEFDEIEKSIYKSFENDAQVKFNRFVREGLAKKKYTEILSLLLRLRQISDHPYLALKPKRADHDEIQLGEPHSENLAEDPLSGIEEKVIKRINAIPFDCIIHSSRIDAKHRKSVRKDANSFILDGESIAEKMTKKPSASNDKSQRKIVWRKVCKAKGEYRSQEQMEEDEKLEGDEKIVEFQKNFEWDTYKIDEKFNDEFKDDTENGYQESDKYPNEQTGWKFVPSSKTKVILQKIQWIRKNAPKDKIVVFSQFRPMLTVLERVLRKHDLNYLLYHGNINRMQRKKTIETFKKDEQRNKIPIMLMSLKCAALGLNLTVANHVIFVDLWWNPALEQQAIDRVHRIGQTKHVFVTRMIVKESVEERILNLQREKQKVVDWALDGANFAKQKKLSIPDFGSLFGCEHHH